MLSDGEPTAPFPSQRVSETVACVVLALFEKSLFPSQVRLDDPPDKSAGVPLVEVQNGTYPVVSEVEVPTVPEPPPPVPQVSQ